MARIASGLKLILSQKGIEADVTGREKRPYSIWRKMQGREMNFESLSDVMAFRVIVDDEAECYRALGVVHGRWPMVPGRFKDFISTPKRNGYKSIHTTVLHGENTRIEVQIRTPRMHEESEYGLAAHWAYKQGGEGAVAREAYPWLDDLLEVLHDAASPEELLENARLAMFEDQVFVFTPKGALHQLPRGSTPVDFAYAVHSDLGDSLCRRQGQWPRRAAAHQARQRRPGRDPAVQDQGARSGLGRLCRFGQGARRHPPPCPVQAAAGKPGDGQQAARIAGAAPAHRPGQRNPVAGTQPAETARSRRTRTRHGAAMC